MTESAGRGRGEPVVDTSVAHVARVYDYLLGGTNNFAVDREAAEHVTAAQGGIGPSRARIRANRRFLGRVVRYLAGEVGIRQFLDIGTGIPNEDNVHGVAQQTAPESRIVYVDNDPVVLAHAHALLAGTDDGVTAFVDADLHDPENILTSESEEITRVASAVRDSPKMGYRLNPRGQAEISHFLDGLELIEPGLVRVNRWRPDEAELAESSDSGDFPFYGAVARKP